MGLENKGGKEGEISKLIKRTKKKNILILFRHEARSGKTTAELGVLRGSKSVIVLGGAVTING